MEELKTEDVKKHFGTLWKVYKALNEAGHDITFQAVYQWKEYVPSDRVESVRKLMDNAEFSGRPKAGPLE